MKIQSVVVLGGDTAGLIAALTLKRRLTQLTVRVIRGPADVKSPESEATAAALSTLLFVYLGLKPGQFYREVEPTWRLGTRFLWGSRPEFYHACAREYEQAPPEFPRSVGYYCTSGSPVVGASSALMHQGKAFPRRPDGLPLLTKQHGFHIENSKLLNYLEKRCRECGVIISEETLQEVERSGHSVAAVLLANGERVVADLFIDATGCRSELLGRSLEEPFRSYGNALSETRSRLEKAIPQGFAEQARLGTGHVHARRLERFDEARRIPDRDHIFHPAAFVAPCAKAAEFRGGRRAPDSSQVIPPPLPSL